MPLADWTPPEKSSWQTVAREALISQSSPDWPTPAELYAKLNAEFHFDLDPCPLHSRLNGLLIDWTGRRVFCNPPYGNGISEWLEKRTGTVLTVYLLPARTETVWWHEHAMKAEEIRFVRGRLYFGDGQNPAPFPSVILVYK